MTIAPTTEQDFAARMDKLGVTQSFLAKYLGLSQSAISNAVNELTDSQRTRLNDALRELENVAECFKPMKPLFDDADAVKEWLRSPSLPNLFKLLTDAQLQQLQTSELTAVNALFAKGERLKEEAVVTQGEMRSLEEAVSVFQEKVRKDFLDWLDNPSGR